MMIIYRAVSVIGTASAELITGLIKPVNVTIRPAGKAKETAPIVNKFVSGEMSETYPKWIAVSGIVSINAPIVVARFDVTKLTIALGTFFL